MAASAEYFDDEDTTGQFLADETLQDATGFVTTTDLHKRFTQWCEVQGLRGLFRCALARGAPIAG
jgi:putative DNA primase/helicase